MQEVTMDAKIENLPRMFDFIVSELSRCGVRQSVIRQCKLCAEEVFMNISSYAYHPDTGKVTLRLDTEAKPHKLLFKLVFYDNGKPFNPLSVDEPDLESDVQNRKVGGLGIYLVKKTMDVVQYDYINAQNVLTMEKTLDI